ncbi:MAG TPA: hypothetical protein VFW66_09540 [Gemmatimonadales bacterium]|nr:hypothetical protein [Gemmatimonadales bacterium]
MTGCLIVLFGIFYWISACIWEALTGMASSGFGSYSGRGARDDFDDIVEMDIASDGKLDGHFGGGHGG